MTGPLTGIDVLILAGGKGTRIKDSLPDGCPKIMADINGKTMLDRQFERLYLAGADRVIVTWPQGAPIPITYDGGVLASYIKEPRPLGTVAAVRYARHLLYSNPVVIMNGDTWAEVDWEKMVERTIVEHSPDMEYQPHTRYATAAGVNAGHYAVSQEWLSSMVTTPYRQIETAIENTRYRDAIEIPDFIDIGTPEGLEKARTEIKSRSPTG